MFLAGILLLPLALSVADNDGMWLAIASTTALAMLLGAALLFSARRAKPELTHREGFAVVTLRNNFV